jgi:hypothetical protein
MGERSDASLLCSTVEQRNDMTERTYWIGSSGPYFYDDADDILDENDLPTGLKFKTVQSGGVSYVERVDVFPGAFSAKSTNWGQIEGVSGSDVDIVSLAISELDSDDSVLILLSYNQPGATSTTYKIWTKQDFEYSMIEEIVCNAATQEKNVGSSHRMCILSDGLQPMVINEKDNVVTNCNLYGGIASDTFNQIAQVFKTTAAMDGMQFMAAEFYVGYTGSFGILQQTAYLYDSDGSTVGTNLLATSTSIPDLTNPLAVNGGNGWIRFVFPTPYTLVGETNYAVVVGRSARSTSDYWNFYEGLAKADAVALKNSSSAWGAVTGIADFAFKFYCDQSTGDWTWKVTGDGDTATDVKCSMDALVIRR